jgi:hypothetical protein
VTLTEQDKDTLFAVLGPTMYSFVESIEMTYKPMTATIECPCGKQFEHEFLAGIAEKINTTRESEKQKTGVLSKPVDKEDN